MAMKREGAILEESFERVKCSRQAQRFALKIGAGRWCAAEPLCQSKNTEVNICEKLRI